MPSDGRTFTVATDEAIVDLVRSAKKRLVVIAPAVSKQVAEAVAERFEDMDTLDVRVILDADAEVYRLGFGEHEALGVIREAASKSFLDLREQPGVRIGVIISDENTMVFAPVSKNVEAGSGTAEKPNAIVLTGVSASDLARAAGVAEVNAGDATDPSPPDPEIGNSALEPEKVNQLQEDLNRNPPAKFDITRRMNVFSSRVVYIEFEIKNFSLSRKQVRLPDDFATVGNKELQSQISSRLRAPMADIGSVKLKIGEGSGARDVEVDEKWLQKERKRIVDKYTFQVDNFGRVILREDRQKFDAEVDAFKTVVQRFHSEVAGQIESMREAFVQRFVDEFLDRWLEQPPEYMDSYGHDKTHAGIEAELRRRAEQIFEDILKFERPTVRVVEKNISPKNVEDPLFAQKLMDLMTKRHVPDHIIRSLFASEEAVKAQEGVS